MSLASPTRFRGALRKSHAGVEITPRGMGAWCNNRQSLDSIRYILAGTEAN